MLDQVLAEAIREHVARVFELAETAIVARRKPLWSISELSRETPIGAKRWRALCHGGYVRHFFDESGRILVPAEALEEFLARAQADGTRLPAAPPARKPRLREAV